MQDWLACKIIFKICGNLDLRQQWKLLKQLLIVKRVVEPHTTQLALWSIDVNLYQTQPGGHTIWQYHVKGKSIQPSKHKTFVWHVYNGGQNVEDVGHRCIHVIQMFLRLLGTPGSSNSPQMQLKNVCQIWGGFLKSILRFSNEVLQKDSSTRFREMYFSFQKCIYLCVKLSTKLHYSLNTATKCQKKRLFTITSFFITLWKKIQQVEKLPNDPDNALWCRRS